MPKHYIDEEWDRDALFASRNLVTLQFAADHLKVSEHAIEKAAAPPVGTPAVTPRPPSATSPRP